MQNYEAMQNVRKQLGLPYSDGYMHRLCFPDVSLSAKQTEELTNDVINLAVYAIKESC